MTAATRALPHALAALLGAAERWLVLTGAAIIEINPLRTSLSAAADFVLEGTASAWLATIAATLGEAVS